MNYDQLLFSELRLVSVPFGSNSLDNSALVRAMTVNEELLAIGYALAPKDIIILAQSGADGDFVKRVREYAGDVKAEPMYPLFPQQVMELDEATFRFHQMLHYLSTYGIEQITGAKVRRGWLPDMASLERAVPDDKLLASKTIALVDEKDKYFLPYKKILSRAERMTDKERRMIRECALRLTPQQLGSVTVAFKQNLLDVFNTVFTAEELPAADRLACLHSLCQHTGDVWKCMDYALTRAGYHFRTSQKRLTVKLLESYPVGDFKSNLILSNKKGRRTSLMLGYIDYNTYSRSKPHADAVAAFRSGELRTWESRAKYLAEQGLLGALDYYSERPGMMLRSVTYLLRKGYRAENIIDKLAPHAAELKTQTLVSIVSHFSRPEKYWESREQYHEATVVCDMTKMLLLGRLYALDTPLKGKCVYVDESEFDLSQSAIRVTDKSAEGGYIRSGLAFRIPEEATAIRFFIYWNDQNRVDVDLHAAAADLNGNRINIGWNANYKNGALVFSGDITHSDAAEYIDIDLVRGRGLIDTVSANINLFSGYDTFAEIDECFVGAMAVGRTGEDIKLYDPKNCFFTHYLTSKCHMINYGFIDVSRRVIVFDGLVDKDRNYYGTAERNNYFPVSEYLDILFRAQNVKRAESREQAEAVLVVGKPADENEISLIDNNFFMEG